jgi:hypothetical protein
MPGIPSRLLLLEHEIDVRYAVGAEVVVEHHQVTLDLTVELVPPRLGSERETWPARSALSFWPVPEVRTSPAPACPTMIRRVPSIPVPVIQVRVIQGRAIQGRAIRGRSSQGTPPRAPMR